MWYIGQRHPTSHHTHTNASLSITICTPFFNESSLRVCPLKSYLAIPNCVGMSCPHSILSSGVSHHLVRRRWREGGDGERGRRWREREVMERESGGDGERGR